MKDTKKPSDELRVKTNESLGEERTKTNDYLERKNESIESETKQATGLRWAAADKVLKEKRAEMDGQTSQVDENTLRERMQADKAVSIERKAEDQALFKERLQKRLIAEVFLKKERQTTDTSLRTERDSIDSASMKISGLLSGEQTSHATTKADLVARDHFLAVVSHDLRNMLVAISLGTRFMRMKLAKAVHDENYVESLSDSIDIIERNTTYMDHMISDLLDLEKMTHGSLKLSLESTDISALLRECAELLKPAIVDKSFSIEIHTEESLFVDADSDRLLQVLTNLISNALKFTPQGGTIKMTAQKKGREIEVSITDNGPGIPEEDRSQIFARGSQLHEIDSTGHGLGLFISKWIIDAHKGRIWVDSKIGEGCAFHFTIPL